MTLEELGAREAIRDRIARYNQAGDRGRLDALAACFAEDGVLILPDGERLEGRDAIRSQLATVSGDLARRSGRPLLRHHVSSPTIDLSGAAAQAHCYFAVYTEIGLDHWGGYADLLVLRDRQWLFAERKVRVDGAVGDSLMVHSDAR